MTANEIADALGTTVNGAKSRIRYLVTTQLKVNSKKLAKSYYINKTKNLTDLEYLQISKIPIDWARKYAHMPESQSKAQDPYYGVVRANYRRPNAAS